MVKLINNKYISWPQKFGKLQTYKRIYSLLKITTLAPNPYEKDL